MHNFSPLLLISTSVNFLFFVPMVSLLLSSSELFYQQWMFRIGQSYIMAIQLGVLYIALLLTA